MRRAGHFETNLIRLIKMSLFGWWSGSSEASSTPSSENTEREEDSKQQDEVKEEEKGASWNETLSSTSEALTQGFGSKFCIV